MGLKCFQSCFVFAISGKMQNTVTACNCRYAISASYWFCWNFIYISCIGRYFCFFAVFDFIHCLFHCIYAKCATNRISTSVSLEDTTTWSVLVCTQCNTILVSASSCGVCSSVISKALFDDFTVVSSQQVHVVIAVQIAARPVIFFILSQCHEVGPAIWKWNRAIDNRFSNWVTTLNTFGSDIIFD